MRRQCRRCPWKKATRGRIPHGFARDVRDLIGKMSPRAGGLSGHEIVMQCHETPDDAPLPCVGWMHHQLGPANNIRLRLAVRAGIYDADLVIVGSQHERFEDILIGTPYEVKR